MILYTFIRNSSVAAVFLFDLKNPSTVGILLKVGLTLWLLMFWLVPVSLHFPIYCLFCHCQIKRSWNCLWLKCSILTKLNDLFFRIIKSVLLEPGERSLCTPKSNLSKQCKIILWVILTECLPIHEEVCVFIKKDLVWSRLNKWYTLACGDSGSSFTTRNDFSDQSEHCWKLIVSSKVKWRVAM